MAPNEHMFDNGDIFDAGLLLGRLRGGGKSGQCSKRGATLEPMVGGPTSGRALPDESRAIIESIADQIEDLLPRRGRRPIAWVAQLGWEERPEGPTPYVDVAALDTHAAAAVAECLNEIAGLTYQDWLFRWRRSGEGHRLIRTYPSYDE